MVQLPTTTLLGFGLQAVLETNESSSEQALTKVNEVIDTAGYIMNEINTKGSVVSRES
jgi:hypothetical protein